MNDDQSQKYVQKKASIKLSFEFGPEELIYTYKDSHTDITRTIPYTSITKDQWEYTQKNDWYRNVGSIWLGIGVLLELPDLFHGNSHYPIWLGLGAIMMIVYFILKIPFTVVQAENERILIIKDDAHHDEILAKILDKRRAQLKKIYGDVNFENDLEIEKGKFSVLLKEDVINQEEFDEAVKKLDDHKKITPIPSPFI